MRDRVEPWRALYKTARWRALRMGVLVAAGFECAFCGRIDGGKGALVCDHIEPHGGDVARFWAGPFQCLCKSCHDGTKQRVERRRAGRGSATHPEWLEPSAVPVTVVCGPPCAGKSHWIDGHAGARDVVIDLDRIAAGLVGGPVRHDWDRGALLTDAIWRRNALLGSLAKRVEGRAWLSVMEPGRERRRWWRERLGAERVVVVETPADVCARRAEAAEDRDAEAVKVAAEAWWAAYEADRADVRVDGGVG